MVEVNTSLPENVCRFQCKTVLKSKLKKYLKIKGIVSFLNKCSVSVHLSVRKHLRVLSETQCSLQYYEKVSNSCNLALSTMVLSYTKLQASLARVLCKPQKQCSYVTPIQVAAQLPPFFGLTLLHFFLQCRILGQLRMFFSHTL